MFTITNQEAKANIKAAVEAEKAKCDSVLEQIYRKISHESKKGNLIIPFPSGFDELLSASRSKIHKTLKDAGFITTSTAVHVDN